MERVADILSSLNKYFHYNNLRPGQLDIVHEILDNRDVLICKERGFGKSLCFQLPGVMRSGIVIVICNSVTRRDRKFKELSAFKEVECAYLNKIVRTDAPSNNHKDLRIELKNKNDAWHDLKQIETSGLKFLYVTFDYFKNDVRLKYLLQEIYKKNMLQAVVIDELTFGIQWIETFKREYSELGFWRDRFPKTPFLCFISPTSEEKLPVIINTLHLRNVYKLNEPSIRKTVVYQVLYFNEKPSMIQTATYIKETYGRKSGLVYCFSKEDGETLVQLLKSYDVASIFYDNSLTDKEKNWLEWINQEGLEVVIVALSGSPMDHDLRKVNFVLHTSIPIALDIYIQETSQVGRNNDCGECTLFYFQEDCESHINSIAGPYKERIAGANIETKKQIFADLYKYRQEVLEVTIYAENMSICRQIALLKYLNDSNVVEPCRICDVCQSMRKSRVINLSHCLKKILTTVWFINHLQNGGQCAELGLPYIEYLIDVLLGICKDSTSHLYKHWVFGSFSAWNRLMLRRLIFILLNQKFLSCILLTNDEFEVYQNLVITDKGKQFSTSTDEFGIPHSCEDILINKWLDFDWVKSKVQVELNSIINYYRKNSDFQVSACHNYVCHLSFGVPGTWEDFKKIMHIYDESQITALHRDLSYTCSIYHQIHKSLKDKVCDNQAIYKTKADSPKIHVVVSGRF